MDPLSAFFLGCFVFGFASALLSFVLGGVHGFHIGGHHIDVGGGHHLGGHHVDVGAGHHLDVGGAHHAHVGAHAPEAGHGAHDGGESTLFPVNPTTVLTFLTWFGGAGFILRNFYGLVAAVSLVLAGLAGLMGAGIVFVFLLKVLLPHQMVMDPADYDPVGSVGRVSSPIRAGGIGEVIYTRGGTRRSAGARSVNGQALERGAEVVIARYEQGIAYVQPWEEFVSRERREIAAEGNG
jgi:hypothetical protein